MIISRDQPGYAIGIIRDNLSNMYDADYSEALIFGGMLLALTFTFCMELNIAFSEHNRAILILECLRNDDPDAP